MIHIRGKLRNQRIALGYKQKDVAEAAGIHKGYYSKIEAGERNPATDVWLKIGAFLKIPDDQLVTYMKEGLKKGA